VVIGCNGCSIDTFISSYAYVGFTANGTTTFGDANLLASSTVNYHDINEQFGFDESRWGDYSTVSVDPSDATHFWTIQMLPIYDPLLDGGDLWQMQITELIASVAAPQLAISRTGANATISWPAFASGYQLQFTTNLTTGVGWSAVTQTPSTNGNTISIVLPAAVPQEFFRLKQGP
jgi:hypothetical protein